MVSARSLDRSSRGPRSSHCRLVAAVLFAVLNSLYASVACSEVVHGPETKEALTAEVAIETGRFMKNAALPNVNPHGAVAVSPNGNTYVARVVRGDVRHNGIRVEIAAGHLRDLDSAARHRTVATLFSTGLGTGPSDMGAHLDAADWWSPIHWIDSDNVAFLWNGDGKNRQVLRVNLTSGAVRLLTQHRTHVLTFDTAGDTLIYNALVQHDFISSKRIWEQGFAVPGGSDLYSILQGDVSGLGIQDKLFSTEWFVQRPEDKGPRKVSIAGRDVAPDNRHRAFLSPDGHYALLNTNAVSIPDDWDNYTDPTLKQSVQAARRGALLDYGRHVHQLYVLDVERQTSRPLWNAATVIMLSDAEWSHDGRHLLIAPTFLPPDDTDAAGLAGEAVAVVDVQSGRYDRLPLRVRPYEVEALRWLDAGTVQILERRQRDVREYIFRKTAHGWQQSQAGSEARAKEKAPGVRMELREDLRTPPALFAVDIRTGETRQVLDPNPELASKYRLGRVERLEGELEHSIRWEALLFAPTDYVQGRRYPLVIQSSYGAGARSDVFTLYGDQEIGLGPAQFAPYPGQILANRGIFVLHLYVRGRLDGPQEAATYMHAFETVAEQLVSSGLVDRGKVGLAGFSRNGYYVEYALTHSQFPFAAAIAADNWDPSYFQQTLMGYSDSATTANGAPPFGSGLASWLTHSPGFNVDRIRTPLWKVAQSGGAFSVLASWEVFVRLRTLKRPVEFYVMPDAQEHGAHNTQNPRQLLAVQQGAVDWFDFWLNDLEDRNAGKVDQYVRWRGLRELHRASAAQRSSIGGPGAHQGASPSLKQLRGTVRD